MSSDSNKKPTSRKVFVWLRTAQVLALAILPLAFSSCEEPVREFISRNQVITDDFVRLARPVGLSVSVRIGGEWEDIYHGQKVVRTNTEIDSLTIFQQGTASLHVVSFLYANALVENVVRPQSTLRSLLPGLAVPSFEGTEITLQHLAEHSSGLPLNPNNVIDTLTFNENNPYQFYTQDSLFNFLSSYNLAVEPGEQYQLSFVGYALLAIAIENAYATPFEQLYQEKMADRYGFSESSTFDIPSSLEDQLARTYDLESNELEYWSPNAFKYALGFHSTSEDMKLIAEEYLKESTPLRQLLSLMLEQRTQQTTIAWNIIVTNGTPFYYMAGQTAGHEMFFGFSPDEEYAMVLLTNSGLTQGGSRFDLIFLANQLLEARFAN